MDEKKMTETAEAATAAINLMAESIAPLAAGAHVALLALLDVLREDPGFNERFESALARRVEGQPPFVHTAAGAFVALGEDDDFRPQ